MMNIRKIGISVALLVSLVLPSSAFAQENMDVNVLNEEAVAFLEEHNVDEYLINQMMITNYSLSDDEMDANSYNESILSLKRSSTANGFTDEQIQAYVKGLVGTSTKLITDDMSASTMASDRPADDGIGYEVRSLPGYIETTAFCTLPSVYQTGRSSAYMMYTIGDSIGSTGIDIGLFYEDGNGGIGWRGFAMQNGVMSDISSKINTLRAGSSVYFDVTMATNGVTRCRILDGNDFSNVLYDVSYNVSNKGINRSNVTFNRQMTLCDSQKQYNDGSYLLNGGFDKAYVYASNGSYDKTLTTNTHSSHRGAFGTNSTNRNQVKVNSYQPWYMEDVSINF